MGADALRVSGLGRLDGNTGRRGVYFDDPDRHLMEAITEPYGETPEG